MRSARALALAEFVVAAITAAAAGACHDATPPAPPPPPFALSLRTADMWYAYDTVEQGLPVVMCHFRLDATASGSGAARWQTATFDFRWGDRTTVQGSVTLDSATLGQAFGIAGVAAGFTRSSEWRVSSPFDSELDIRLHALVGDTLPLDASVSIPCGREFVSGSPPPVLSQMAFHQHAGPWQPGDATTIDVTLEDPQRLWLTAFSWRGALQGDILTNEHRDTSVTRSYPFQIPAAVTLGDSEVFTVQTYDEFGVEGHRSIAMTPFVDSTPPTLYGVPCTRVECNGVPVPAIPASVYFVGEQLTMQLYGTDNHGLASVHWGLVEAGVADSAALSGQTEWNTLAQMLVRPEWVGQQHARAYARDLSGGVSDTIRTAPGAFDIRPTVARPIMMGRRESTLIDPYHRDPTVPEVLVDARRGVFYTHKPNAATIDVRSLTTLDSLRTITLPAVGFSMDVTASNDSIVVTLPTMHALGFVDLADSADSVAVAPFPQGANGRHPLLVKTLANGKALVLVATDAYYVTYQLIEYAVASGRAAQRSDIGTFGTAVSMERSGDHGRVEIYTSSCHAMYTAATNQFSTCRVLPYERAASLDSTGAHVAFGADVYDADLQLISHGQVVRAEALDPSVFAPDGGTLYRMYSFADAPGGGIVRMRVSDGAVLDRTPIRNGRMLRADGGDLFVFSADPDTLSKVSMDQVSPLALSSEQASARMRTVSPRSAPPRPAAPPADIAALLRHRISVRAVSGSPH